LKVGLLLVRGDEYFMIRQMRREGLSISEIARKTGRDRKTVRKAVAGGSRPSYRPRPKRPSKLDPYKLYLEKRMDIGVYNAVKLLREIKARGYDGGITILKDFIKPYRDKEKAVIRYETPPGQQAQVDWGICGRQVLEGETKTVYCFLMTLGYSRYGYLEFTTRCDTRAFIRAHINAFNYFGGIPKSCLYDNLKSVRLATDENGVVFNPTFLDFADTFAFLPRLCRPYRPQTKGKVESGIKYIKNNFILGETFASLEELNKQGRIWLDTVANIRIHGTTGEVPIERLKEEKLNPIHPHMTFDTALYAPRKITRDCLVSYKGSRYGVPHRFAGDNCLVRDLENGFFEVLVGSEVIIRHRLSGKKGRTIISRRNYVGIETKTKRPQPKVPLITPVPIVEVEKRSLNVYSSLVGELS